MLPVIDISALLAGDAGRHSIAAQIGEAFREWGFFYVVGHGIDAGLIEQLQQASRKFFAQDLQTKLEIDMSLGGRAWRGYFPVGGELTSGLRDMKEGIYFGAELDENHPMVICGVPLHGRNLFPASVPELRDVVLSYIKALTRLGHNLIAAIASGLGLDESYFNANYTADPLILFRIFNYPPMTARSVESAYGVGEHTDYGLLTILWQDMSGGLQIKKESDWVDVQPIPNSFVCNVGDMLDRLSGGYYLSAPHRVWSPVQNHRLSFAFFFDPNFNAQVRPPNLNAPLRDNKNERWDHASVHEFHGTYGDYLLNKVSKVFPQLGRKVL